MTLSKKKIEEIWQAYQEHPSAYFAGKKCKVSRATVTKYRDEEHWDERLLEIRALARAIADNKAARQLAKELEASNYMPTVKDYDSLVKVKLPGQFLKGAPPYPDSRSEHVPSFEWRDNERGGKTLRLKKTPDPFDLFSFARKVLGYSRLEEDPHLQWCVELDQRHSRSLWLEPRHTYKSTVFSKSYPIWRLLENPNLRILIVNATAENAEAFLSEIVGHLLRNPHLLEVYQTLYHTYPLDPHAAKTKSIILNTRTHNFSEPNIGTVGALGNLVSSHYDLIIVDDLCNIDDRESHSIRKKKKRWFRDLGSVLSPEGELVIVGTHWHFDDVYSYIITKLNPQLPDDAKYLIHRDSCYLDDGVTPRFPNILSANKLAATKIEKGTISFSCQYLNRPIPTEHQIFKLESMFKISKSEINLEQAEAYGFWDPSLGVSDYSAVITLLKYNGHWIVFHADLSRSPQSKTIDKIIELHSFFNYKSFGIEANSLGKAKSDTGYCNFELVLRERQANANVTVPYKLVWHTTPKRARIQGIESYYSNGQLCFLDTWNQEYLELIEQLIQFPLAAHDDGPDALAGAVSLLLAASKAPQPILYPRLR
jgi:predicted phage terminase large subunit-like protein